LQARYLRFLDRSLELAHQEVARTRNQPEFHPLAKMYQEKLRAAWDLFCNQYHNNLIEAFKKFQDLGCLELITCAATHGYLPLMVNPHAVRAQIQVGVQTHIEHLGRPPSGIWLPECAYEPGLEKHLREAGLRYFFLDNHGLLHATPRPKYGVHAPLYCPNGMAVFGRDKETSQQVWSAETGYPGDYDYRDFYRDIGFDLDYDTIRPFIASTGDRKMTGFKYYRITGKDDNKEPYHPGRAMDKAAQHAGHFMFNREKQIEHLAGLMDRPPIVVAPYDAELFGHWWWEGPQWIDYLMRKTAYDQNVFELITPSEYLERFPKNQVATPSASSWGYKGFHEHWMDEKNDWVYRHLHKAANRMVELAQKHKHALGLERRALNQAARELLLAQSSDWAFIMFAGTMVEYAVKRTKDHLHRFNRLYDEIQRGAIDELWLTDIESKDNLFPNINYRVYA